MGGQGVTEPHDHHDDETTNPRSVAPGPGTWSRWGLVALAILIVVLALATLL